MSPPFELSPPIESQVSPHLSRPARIALAAAAFAAGFARAWIQPAATDAGFHLLRAGGPLFRGSLEAYAVPPGGEGAPLLGAIAAQLGTAAPGGIEQILRIPGAVALGLCAVLLLFTVARRAGGLAAIFAVVLLLLVPSFTSSVAARPDQSLAGLFFLAALCAALERESFARQERYATLSSLASPFAIPSLIAFPFYATTKERRNARAWIAPAVALAVLALLSIALPEGMRSEIVRGILSGWGAPASGFSSTARAMASSPITALILAIPLLAAARKTPVPGVPQSLHLTSVACVLATILFAKPGAFLGFMPAIAPATCLLVALLVAAIPDRAAAPGALRRPILFALFLPILAFVLESDREERRIDAERSRAARDAQVGAHLRERSESEDSIVAVSTGALAYFSERPVHSMDRLRALDAAHAIVFEKALLASRPQEIHLMHEPSFLTSFAPHLFRRGMHLEFQDAVWLRRDPPFHISASAGTESPPGTSAADTIAATYVNELIRGWNAHAREATGEAARAFAAAAAAEPAGLGIAHEWSGILEELQGHTDIAATRFETALRDPATARARGHLADRAISTGDFAHADSLLKQALAWNVDEPEIWGTLARLQIERDELAPAKESSMHALQMYPANARLLMNHGSILWRTGDKENAKQLWIRAVQLDPRLRRFLGKFENAPASASAPPPIPLFSFAKFTPQRAAPMELQKKERAP